MEEFLNTLKQHIEIVEDIGNKIEGGETYMEDLKKYLPFLNEMITTVFDILQNSNISLALEPRYVLQVLKDIIYGIEQEDAVILLDVLRYGLLDIFAYIGLELGGSEADE